MKNFQIGHTPHPIGVFPNQLQQKTNTAPGGSSTSFSDVLQDKLKTPLLKFSNHAEMRLRERGMTLNETQLQTLQQGVMKAKEKGAKESLILMHGMAFVVSVKNDTVITAIDPSKMDAQVITNIDSAVML